MTTIEWTDETWNPVSGCTKVSAGCKNCYAERVFPRVYGKDTVEYLKYLLPKSTTTAWPVAPAMQRREFTDIRLHPDRLDAPLHWKRPRRVFVNSMSDLFHEYVSDEFIIRVFDVMRACEALGKGHQFQILTKRPDRMRDIASRLRFDNSTEQGRMWLANSHDGPGWRLMGGKGCTGLRNVWLGVSVEDRPTVSRIDTLRATPAAVRFVSFEPLLEDVGDVDLTGISWVIVGGESGPKARPCDVAWIRSIKDQCRAASVPVFVKQLGANVRGWCGGIALGDEPESDYAADFCDLYEAHESASSCQCLGRGCWHITGKGGDMKLWPLDLRVREYPACHR